jgi:hypothetical protein
VGTGLRFLARDTSDLKGFTIETGAQLINCDALNQRDVEAVFKVEGLQGRLLDVAIYNPTT